MNKVQCPARSRVNRGKSFPRVAPLAVLGALLLLLSGAAASADPIRIVNSGVIYMLAQDNETGFQFRGANFDIGGGEVYWHPVFSCGPCAPGSSVNLSATLTPRLFPPGSATIDGHAYDSVYFSGNFDVTAGSVTVPHVAAGGGYVWPATPFTFTGTVAGYADSTLAGMRLFSTRLSGRGSASVGFFNDGNGVFADGFDYRFSNAAATPEPGTLLLFAPGAAWIAAQFRRRRKTAA